MIATIRQKLKPGRETHLSTRAKARRLAAGSIPVNGVANVTVYPVLDSIWYAEGWVYSKISQSDTPDYGAVRAGLTNQAYVGFEALGGRDFRQSGGYQVGDFIGNAVGIVGGVVKAPAALNSIEKIVGSVGKTLNSGADLSAAAADASGAAAADESGVTGTCLANSFSADTQVATDHGEVAISDLKVGDKVLAYNAQTGKDEYQPIEAVLVHNDPALEDLTIDGEVVHTTPGHPFYTQDKGWVAAGNLTVGEEILKADGSYGKVQAIKMIDRTQPMYNLTVHDDHDFFVGSGQWLVHNECLESYVAQQLRKEGWDVLAGDDPETRQYLGMARNEPAADLLARKPGSGEYLVGEVKGYNEIPHAVGPGGQLENTSTFLQSSENVSPRNIRYGLFLRDSDFARFQAEGNAIYGMDAQNYVTVNADSFERLKIFNQPVKVFNVSDVPYFP